MAHYQDRQTASGFWDRSRCTCPPLGNRCILSEQTRWCSHPGWVLSLMIDYDFQASLARRIARTPEFWARECVMAYEILDESVMILPLETHVTEYLPIVSTRRLHLTDKGYLTNLKLGLQLKLHVISRYKLFDTSLNKRTSA
jgi:hypothetical protein